MKVVVIGGGPAGMIAAIAASSKQKNEVILLEKMNSCGKKLLITGKGRCNITSSLPMEDFISNVPGNGRFLYSSFENYTNKDIIQLLENHAVKVKEERGNRIFPESDKAIDVLKALEEQIRKNGIIVQSNSKVEQIQVKEGSVIGVTLENGKIIKADKVILATGGKSYPGTGSTGDGYRIAEKIGHTITKLAPSLVPITMEEKSLRICQSLQGLSLKNIEIRIKDNSKKKVIYEDFGEMLFTHFGVSGPIILSGSSHLLRYPKLESLLQDKKIELEIDLKPALSEEKLGNRILRDFEKYKNKEIKNALDDLLPQKMILPIIQRSEIEEQTQVNSITKEQRIKLVNTIKHVSLIIKGFRPIEEAIVTAGGISIKEIDPKTMESKIVKGLYFAGEIIDVDAYTGGFNLQIAYSTGYTAGSSE